jgi:antitoxin (DNA-binding transcriptional repressor) of toxin-antitoxin stability system
VHNTATHVGIRDLRANLSGLLRKVRHGATLIVMSRDQVVAEIHPPSGSAHGERKLGLLKGRIRMAPDFDELPPDVLDAMENG